MKNICVNSVDDNDFRSFIHELKKQKLQTRYYPGMFETFDERYYENSNDYKISLNIRIDEVIETEKYKEKCSKLIKELNDKMIKNYTTK